MNEEKFAQLIYNIVIDVRDTLSLPTHKTLATTTAFSLGLFAVSLLADLLKFYTFVSWQGSLICTIALVILLWIERSENDALLRMYRSARASAEKAVCRAKTAGSNLNSKRSANRNDRNKQATGKRNERGSKGKNSGRHGSNSRRKRN